MAALTKVALKCITTCQASTCSVVLLKAASAYKLRESYEVAFNILCLHKQPYFL